MDKIEHLNICYHGMLVGKLASYGRCRTAFQYDTQWIKNGFSISPLSLPLEDRVFIADTDPFDGVFGVFNDSLPDGWGRLLVDRILLKNGEDPARYGNLNRLAIVGDSGMGALTYEPDLHFHTETSLKDLDRINEECQQVLQSKDDSITVFLDDLFAMGGSSGGVRPKIFTKVDRDDWIIKFPSGYDPADIGKEEYDYAICAKKCGIEIPEVRLFSSKKCSGYFGTRRYDRVTRGNGSVVRIHCVTVSGLLETSHRIPNLDYDSLMKLVYTLTRDPQELTQMYKRMCFNVFAHNRDDHSKNFSLLYDDTRRVWRLTPAYDMTYSCSLGGEHATMVHGNGSDPGMDDLLAVAEEAGINKKKAKEIAEEIHENVEQDLHKYLKRKH
ncbi:MAG: type II toxin-antitoxin system HipA family toxin [Lachnospiraceae bacterium]|nr:type II toxin-antitoxin system HipA family toxin [Lachnospiraceae bacterium]